MKRKSRLSAFSAIVLIMAVSGFLSSCEKEKEYQEKDLLLIENAQDSSFLKCAGHGNLIDYELVNLLSAEEIKVFVGASFESLIQYDVKMYKVSYRTLYKGSVVTASGIVGIPDKPIDHKTPVIMYDHGTRITEADLLPSSGFDLISIVSAANGKICFAADYIGFGDSKHIFHPYLVKSAAIYPVCDMIIAGKQFLRKEFKIMPKLSITIFGFSQGASITMAVQRELENNPYYRRFVHLNGVAMATGPYDLHGHTMLPIISQETYSSPSFIVFTFISYNYHYNLGIDFNDIFKNSYAQLFLDLVTQNKTSNEINSMLPVTVSELFQDDFLNDLLNEQTPFNNLFKLNVTHLGWVPESPTRIYHSPVDEIVPYSNAQTAYETFVAAGSNSVELITLPPVDHVTAAFMAFADIISWIDSM